MEKTYFIKELTVLMLQELIKCGNKSSRVSVDIPKLIAFKTSSFFALLYIQDYWEVLTEGHGRYRETFLAKKSSSSTRASSALSGCHGNLLDTARADRCTFFSPIGLFEQLYGVRLISISACILLSMASSNISNDLHWESIWIYVHNLLSIMQNDKFHASLLFPLRTAM